jgi:hypothetical protein
MTRTVIGSLARIADFETAAFDVNPLEKGSLAKRPSCIRLRTATVT